MDAWMTWGKFFDSQPAKASNFSGGKAHLFQKKILVCIPRYSPHHKIMKHFRKLTQIPRNDCFENLISFHIKILLFWVTLLKFQGVKSSTSPVSTVPHLSIAQWWLEVFSLSVRKPGGFSWSQKESAEWNEDLGVEPKKGGKLFSPKMDGENNGKPNPIF